MLVRSVYVLAGFLSLLLGIIGIFLPVFPTTPFILLAAFCFSRGSKRIHRWLLNNRFFGGVIRDWEESRIIRLRVKIIVSIFLPTSIIYPLFIKPLPMYVNTVIILVIIGVLIFIWSRPSGPRKDEMAG